MQRPPFGFRDTRYPSGATFCCGTQAGSAVRCHSRVRFIGSAKGVPGNRLSERRERQTQRRREGKRRGAEIAETYAEKIESKAGGRAARAHLLLLSSLRLPSLLSGPTLRRGS